MIPSSRNSPHANPCFATLPRIDTSPPQSPHVNPNFVTPSPHHFPRIGTPPPHHPVNNPWTTAPSPQHLPQVDMSPPRPVNNPWTTAPSPQHLPQVAPPPTHSTRKRAIQILNSLAEFSRNHRVCLFDGPLRCKNKECKLMHHAQLADAIEVLWNTRKYLTPMKIIRDLGAVCNRETTCEWEASIGKCMYSQACHKIHQDHLLYAANSLWFIVHPPRY
jgi:hypothetical protein